jgi:hypothetical protein
VELNEEILREIRDGSGTGLSKLMDSLQVQEYLNISRSTRIRHTKDEILKAKKMGSRSYYSRKQIEEIKNLYLK